MSLKEKITSDFILAFKSQEKIAVMVLKLLKSSIHNKEIELHQELNDDEIIKVLLSEVRKRKDSIEQFKKGNRDDLVDQETEELKIIQKYLPEMKSKEEIKNIICAIIKEESIEKSITNFGQVMKLAMQKLGSQAEGNLVSEIVKEQLN